MKRVSLLIVLVAIVVGLPSVLDAAPRNNKPVGQGTNIGLPGKPANPSRTIEVVMREDGSRMVFSPDALQVKRGEQIRFVLRNEGKLEHAFVLGTSDEIRVQADLVKTYPDMAIDDANAKHLKPGARAEILWRFTKSGRFEFASLLPGQIEAGMKGTIVVK